MTSEGAFAVVISNTPIGDITLNRSGPEGISWRLPSDAQVHAAQVEFGDDETDPTNQDTGPVIRLVTFGAGEGCNNSERQRRACGELPGGFPLAGRIDVGFDTSNYQAVITANVAITTPFEVTGLVRLRVDLVEGFLLDTLGFGIGNVTMGPLLLERLAFVYSPPGRDPAHPTGDTWDVAVAVGIGTVPRLFVDGRIIFVAGRFNYGSADVTLPVGIPIYAGVFLNRFAGVIGLDPTRIGGGIGIPVIQLLQINTDFLYVDRSEGLAQLSGTGTVAISGINIGRAYIDYWTDGYFAFGGVPRLRLPVARAPDGRDLRRDRLLHRGATGRQLPLPGRRPSGRDRVLHPRRRADVLQQRLDGGLPPGPRRRPVRRPQPAHRRDAHPGDRLRPVGVRDRAVAPAPVGPAVGAAHSAQAAPDGRTITVAEGERALVLSVKGTGGAPQLVLIGPDGHRYVPTSEAAKPVRDGTFTSVFLPAAEAVLLRVENPAAGDWGLEPSRGRRRSNR